MTEKTPEKLNHFTKYKEFLNLRICLIGGSCVGKKTISIHLRNKYNLETILLNDILEKSEKTQEFLKKGQKISDSLIVESILEKIDSLFEN